MHVKFQLFFVLFFTSLFTGLCTNAQSITGEWYAKHRSFSPRSSARIFTRKEVRDWQQHLSINKKLEYTFTEITISRTQVTRGVVYVKGNSIIFIPANPKNSKPQEYSLFRADKELLIYSSARVPEPVTDEEPSIFQKVEIDPVYGDGEQAFLKLIYQQLGTPANRDTVYNNNYSVVIGLDGKPDISTFKTVSANPVYEQQVKKILSALPGLFTPGQQNGRFIKGWMRFGFVY